jgi:hypothetical protein
MTGFLGQALIYIVPFLLVLTFIVTIHELDLLRRWIDSMPGKP